MENSEKVNILIVDDNVKNLLSMDAVLRPIGENVVKATSGEQALKCLLQQDFALIILDVHMSGMDGFETAKLIRERNKTRHIPIIFITASSYCDTSMFQGYAVGAVDFLLKPVIREILLSKVSVFVELFKKTQQVKKQATELAIANQELMQLNQKLQTANKELEAKAIAGELTSDQKNLGENMKRDVKDQPPPNSALAKVVGFKPHSYKNML